MTDTTDTLDRLRRVIAEQSGHDIAAVTPEAELYADLGMDSLDEVEMAMGIEEEFGLDLEAEAFTGCSTVADILKVVEAVRGKAS